MVRMRFWCDSSGDGSGAIAHAAFTLESEPLGCNPVITASLLFTFLFGVPSAAQSNPSHIAYSLPSAHTRTMPNEIRFECCEAFRFAHAANLLLLVRDAPITSNTRVNIYKAVRVTHTCWWNTKWNLTVDSLVGSINSSKMGRKEKRRRNYIYIYQFITIDCRTAIVRSQQMFSMLRRYTLQ